MTSNLSTLVALLVSLNIGQAFGQRFESVPSSHSGIRFENTFHSPDSVDTSGFIYLWNGGGVGIGDVNNDGLQDIFLTGNSVGNRLYINKGDLRFEDKTSAYSLPLQDSAWNTGVVMADVNGDGWLDIYVSRSQLGQRFGPNLLYINEGGQKFSENGKEFGLDVVDNCTQSSFFDADNDGDLDVYVLTYPKEGAQYSVYKSTYNQGADRLFINKDGRFDEDEQLKKLLKDHGFGLGLLTADFDQNGEVDIYVANDLLSVDRFYKRENGKYTEVLDKLFGHVSFNSMGSDAGDLNNDGWLDLITVDMFPEEADRRHLQSFLSEDHRKIIQKGGLFEQYVRNMLHMNSAGRGFKEVGALYGIEATDWSWSPLLFDSNNDGLLDLLITNSLKKDFMNKDLSMFILDSLTRHDKAWQKNRVYNAIVGGLPEFRLQNKLFTNSGHELKDRSISLLGEKKVNSTGAAVSDLDNDGDVDIVLNNLDTTALILQNMLIESGSESQFLRLNLRASGKNTYALNSKVMVYSGDTKRIFETINARGFQSCSENVVHIGFTETNRPDSLVIFWPNGSVSTVNDPGFGKEITVRQPDKTSAQPVQPRDPAFWVENGLIEPPLLHMENFQNDFKVDPILHRSLSKTGPGIAIADVNGDGITDFYQCAAKGSSGRMYLGSPQGKFELAPLQPWETEIEFEESAALLVDVDSDGDLDLVIVGSGYESSPQSPWYWDRLYLNNGDGFFSKTNGLPRLSRSKSCIAAGDFDGDGDVDLFIGGRYGAEGYPTAADSYLLVNDGNGNFTDSTAELAPALTAMGLVTSALWSDFDNDGDLDLLVAGEWMTPQFLENRNGKFIMAKAVFDNPAMSGWWNSIEAGDLDNDGDIDYVLGNFGENSIIKASETTPVKLYYPKLTQDQRPTPVLTYFVEGRESLFAKRDKMLDQVLPFRRRFITYASYAAASVTSVVGENAPNLWADNLKSVVLLNEGARRFKVTQLPVQAQAFPVFGMHLIDLDDDQHLDLLLAGNCLSMSNEIGNLDAGGFMALKGLGDGTFSTIAPEMVDLFITSDAKALGFIGSFDREYRWLLTSNNGATKVILSRIPKSVSLINHTNGYICFPDGKRRKLEEHCGSGFWTQHAPFITVPTSGSLCR